jgi:hypothetical protein
MPSGSSPLTGSSSSRTSGSPSRATGEAEPLAHAEGEAAQPLVRCRLEPDQLDDLVDPPLGQGVAAGQREQVGVGGARRVVGPRIDERADAAHRPGELPVGQAEHPRRAGGRPGEAEDAAQRGRLAGAVGAQEAGDPARMDRDREVVDGDPGAELLGQAVDLDHPVSMASCANSRRAARCSAAGRRGGRAP